MFTTVFNPESNSLSEATGNKNNDKIMLRNTLATALKSTKAIRTRAVSSKQTRAFTQATLPDLPYSYGELEDAISGQIMEIHRLKHHNTYVTNFNATMGTISRS